MKIILVLTLIFAANVVHAADYVPIEIPGQPKVPKAAVWSMEECLTARGGNNPLNQQKCAREKSMWEAAVKNCANSPKISDISTEQQQIVTANCEADARTQARDKTR